MPPNTTDKLHVLEEAEIYENQVYGWVNGWAPSEGKRLAWSNPTGADGAKSREMLQRALGLLPEGWRWAGDWKVGVLARLCVFLCLPKPPSRVGTELNVFICSRIHTVKALMDKENIHNGFLT
jgi:hypothetical protein